MALINQALFHLLCKNLSNADIVAPCIFGNSLLHPRDKYKFKLNNSNKIMYTKKQYWMSFWNTEFWLPLVVLAATGLALGPNVCI